MEYALKYQEHLKAVIISNMMASIPRYNEYAEKVLMPEMDQSVLGKSSASRLQVKPIPLATWSCSFRIITSIIFFACQPTNGLIR